MTRDEECAIEWECQKVLRLYYQHVDRREFEKAIALFTPDVDWLGLGALLKGREKSSLHWTLLSAKALPGTYLPIRS